MNKQNHSSFVIYTPKVPVDNNNNTEITVSNNNIWIHFPINNIRGYTRKKYDPKILPKGDKKIFSICE